MGKGRGISDRLVFPEGEQREFLIAARERLSYASWTEMSRDFDFHRRSLSDWAQEKWRISEKAARAIAEKSDIEIPATVTRLQWVEHAKTAGEKGKAAVLKKYGKPFYSLIDEAYRQKQWQQWWEKTGQYLPSPIDNEPQPIQKPRKSAELAEFLGILLGDGGITQYQVKITLHSIDDKLYMEYVKQLAEKLFHVPCVVQRNRRYKAADLVISRVELVRHCVSNLGLVTGNKVKQQVDIPDWIKRKQSYMNACVRGLVDTDGSVFTHRYRVNSKEYAYKKMAYTSMSKPLLMTVYKHLKELGLTPRIARGRDVRIDSKKDISAYFDVIGSHNPKHLKRYLR